MQLVLMSEGLQPYLEESMWIDYQHPLIQEKIHQIKQMASTKLERAELAFNFVRDEITHSFDIDSTKVTASASEAIEQREGICFAKAHLLAALLRGMGIPTGFCYQRVTRKGTVESGYALHGLNAVYFDELQKWFRVDPRGNKPGVYTEFSIYPEKLAYPIRTEMDEIDFPYVYSEPLADVITSLQAAADCKELFFNRPEMIIK